MTESKKHSNLKNRAKQILLTKGYSKKQIIFEYHFDGKKRVDCAGISKEKKIGIECGSIQKNRLRQLRKKFDEVIHLKYESGGIINLTDKKFLNWLREQQTGKDKSIENALKRLVNYERR